MFMLVTPSEHIQQQLFWYGYYEKPVALFLEHIVDRHSIILDVGANVGYFTLISAKKAKAGKVFAFEPVKGLFQRLQKNIDQNYLQNVEISQFAVGEADEDAVIFISSSENQGMSSVKPPENFSGVSQAVRIIRIDDWATKKNIKRLDIIKLDVEGSELFALRGMDQTLTRFKPVLIVEINPDTLAYFDLVPGDVLVYLNSRNYIPFKISETGSLQQASYTDANGNIVFIHSEKLNEFSSHT